MIDSVMLQLATQSGEFPEAFWIAVDVIVNPRNMILIVLATLLGLMMGAIPGLGGPITIALLIPLTFDMNPNVALMIMAASLGGVNFGGSISAILLNVPGTAPNAATLFDGYPLAQQGRAGEAIAASALASASGAVLGLILFVLLLPILTALALAFWAPELFWLALIGLATIAVATTGSILSDLIAGALGLMITFHGLNRITGGLRFTWDITYLQSGIPLIPAVIGLFAIAEMIHLMGKGTSISEAETISGGRVKGMLEVVKNRWTFFRSAVIGWVIGIVPGVGGTIANFVAYFQAKQLSAEPGSFGSGNIQGVIASEAANDAKDGGSMVPTLGLGIPGSASTAVLLGAFVLQGVTPGPLLLRENLQIVFIIILTLLIANIITSSIGFVGAQHLAKFTRIPVTSLAPIIVLIGFMGAFIVRQNFGDILVALGFGIIGVTLVKLEISRVILILGIVLGPLIEQNFHRSLQISQGSYAIFYTRPLSIMLIVVLVAIIVIPLWRSWRSRPDPG
jgi:putative tricarboxylic transport membrane protein